MIHTLGGFWNMARNGLFWHIYCVSLISTSPIKKSWRHPETYYAWFLLNHDFSPTEQAVQSRTEQLQMWFCPWISNTWGEFSFNTILPFLVKWQGSICYLFSLSFNFIRLITVIQLHNSYIKFASCCLDFRRPNFHYKYWF